MSLSLNEIKKRAIEFAKEWEDAENEDAEAKPFWVAFFNVFGISMRKIAYFEEAVKKCGNKQGFIDLFWPGTLLIEHKSKGKNLDKAYSQAIDYFPGIKDEELPKYIIVSDFQTIRLYDLEDNKHYEFKLIELYNNIHLFDFILGHNRKKYKDEDPVNIKAAELMGKLHDALKESGYDGHQLEIFLVRLMFCLFADDTGVFNSKDDFTFYLDNKTKEDGTDTGIQLSMIYQILNTPHEKRNKNLDEDLAVFPYVNGGLFEETLAFPSFDSKMRRILLDCCYFDWSRVSPAIFGSMFQSVMNKEARRNLGAHYTSEKNILKIVKSLFLDGMYAEFDKTKNNLNGLHNLLDKIKTLKFFDPACGCGNFLIISYRELRLLEIEIHKEIQRIEKQKYISEELYGGINVDAMYGIEIEEFPARIAQVALWITDHQMNVKIWEEFGYHFTRLPLKTSANIVNGNALQLDWETIVPKDKLNYILGNPPFYGAMMMNPNQREDIKNVSNNMKNHGVLDYVSSWYIKASDFIQGTKIKCAFVSTNSITQGEQVGILWEYLLSKGIKICFAHRTFKWSNEAKGNAAVYCVIIGFGNFNANEKYIFDYDNIKGDPHEIKVKNINPYLIDGEDFVITNRSEPLCNVPKMSFGSMPRDGGHFIFKEDEKDDFLKIEPNSEKWIRPYTGAQEFINGYTRYCLWLNDISPEELRKLPEVLKKVELVRKFRLDSKAQATRRFAEIPTLFCQIAQPDTDYLLVPRVSSERRKFIPIGFVNYKTIANDQVMTIPNATLYHFGILTSAMHMIWTSHVCGRLKSDYRYSKDIVYNNFPWPDSPTLDKHGKVEEAAKEVLAVRDKYMNPSVVSMEQGSYDIRQEAKASCSLADLYDPLTMPKDLLDAHKRLDKAVDLCYRPQPFVNELARLEFLFDLYERYTSLFGGKVKKR